MSVEALEHKLTAVCDVIREIEQDIRDRSASDLRGVNAAKVTFGEQLAGRLRTAVGMPTLESMAQTDDEYAAYGFANCVEDSYDSYATVGDW